MVEIGGKEFPFGDMFASFSYRAVQILTSLVLRMTTIETFSFCVLEEERCFLLEFIVRKKCF